jgi:hypothetical protein
MEILGLIKKTINFGHVWNGSKTIARVFNANP